MDLEERLHTLEVNFGPYSCLFQTIVDHLLKINYSNQEQMLRVPEPPPPPPPPPPKSLLASLFKPFKPRGRKASKQDKNTPAGGFDFHQERSQIADKSEQMLRSGSSFDDGTQHRFQSAQRHQQSDLIKHSLQQFLPREKHSLSS